MSLCCPMFVQSLGAGSEASNSGIQEIFVLDMKARKYISATDFAFHTSLSLYITAGVGGGVL